LKKLLFQLRQGVSHAEMITGDLSEDYKEIIVRSDFTQGRVSDEFDFNEEIRHIFSNMNRYSLQKKMEDIYITLNDGDIPVEDKISAQKKLRDLINEYKNI
ncbi:MAG: hypothetical protein ACOCWO_03915, partial [Candidatus Muiribacteriaceae bacterium]